MQASGYDVEDQPIKVSAVHKKLWLIGCGLLAAAGFNASALAQPDESPPSWRYSKPSAPKSPDWALELKAGSFEPDLGEWKEFYNDDETGYTAFSVGYKLLRTVEFGVELGQMDDSGVGQLPISGGTGGEVDYRLRTAHAYLLLRGIFGEDQVGVPYAGVGTGKAFYRQEVANQPSRSGDTDSEYWRYGLQFLLDSADEPLAAESDRDFGVSNTYLFIEKHDFSAEVDGVELGGDTLFIGLLFEF